jgi:hypothetical protein
MSRRPLFAAAILVLGVGCAESQPRPETVATIGDTKNEPALPFPEPESSWPKVHSVRFHASLPLPEAREWVVDDQSRAELVATHAATRSRVVLFFETEPALMNRHRCEARARELGMVPNGALHTVEDSVTVGPEAYDTRVWVALEPSKTERGPITGHVFAFGAYVRKCLYMHFTSEIPSGQDEAILSQRLALARVRILQGITLDNMQGIPREKETPARRR